MDGIVSLLSLLCQIAGFAAWIVIVIEAFKDEIWKGVVSLLCGLYALYYAIFELDHDYKWVLVGVSLLGTIAGMVLRLQALPAAG